MGNFRHFPINCEAQKLYEAVVYTMTREFIAARVSNAMMAYWKVPKVVVYEEAAVLTPRNAKDFEYIFAKQTISTRVDQGCFTGLMWAFPKMQVGTYTICFIDSSCKDDTAILAKRSHSYAEPEFLIVVKSTRYNKQSRLKTKNRRRGSWSRERQRSAPLLMAFSADFTLMKDVFLLLVSRNRQLAKARCSWAQAWSPSGLPIDIFLLTGMKTKRSCDHIFFLVMSCFWDILWGYMKMVNVRVSAV